MCSTLNMSVWKGVWTCELFFLSVQMLSTFTFWQNCFWTTVTPIKSLTWIKPYKAAADWQVFASTSACFHLLLHRCNLAEYFISANMFVCHTFEVVVSNFTGVKFLADCFFFYCFALPFFPPQRQFSMHRSSKATLSASCWTETVSFRAWLLSYV